MREIITTGKTVEEATQRALEELGVSMEEVSVEVIDMPQRKLFRTIPAKVRVTADDEPEMEAAAPAPAPESAPAPVKEEKAPAAEPVCAEPAAADETPSEEQQTPAPEQDAAQEETPIDLADYPRIAPAVAYLREICEKMGAVDMEIGAVKQGETIILTLTGDKSGMLIGHRGEVMEALSYLCSLVANRGEGEYMKLGLDINHYRNKREENLTALAKRLAEKAARTGKSHTLEPMNPYERRIIHAAVSEVEGVKSESVGEGATRRVVILPEDMELSAAVRRSSSRRSDNRRGSGRSGRYDRSRKPYQKQERREKRAVRRAPSGDGQPTPLRRTESINDGENLPLFGKVEL